MSKSYYPSVNKEQLAYYKDEWNSLRLSNKPGKTGWRTNVPAYDFIQFIDWLNDKRISGIALDLGCGGGRHAIVLARNNFDVYGIDFAEAAINIAEIEASSAGVSWHTHFQVGDVLSLPYEDGMFDVINDDGCLHHINPNDWQIYVQNVHRVIKKGGILRIKVFSKNCNYFKKYTVNNSSWVKLKDSNYCYFFNDEELHLLFRKGFKLINLLEKVHSNDKDKTFFFMTLQSL
jgi:ubiquinone/menaquinone biosynthesis C-methylase UbiE